MARWNAAQRAAISKRMKRYHAQRRNETPVVVRRTMELRRDENGNGNGALRDMVREEIRAALREEVRAALAEMAKK